jgi:hypothetical protein
MAQKTLLHFDIKRHIVLCLEIRHCTMPLEAVLYFGKKIVLLHCETLSVIALCHNTCYCHMTLKALLH